MCVFFFFKQKTAYEMLRSLVGSEMCIKRQVGNASAGESAAWHDAIDRLAAKYHQYQRHRPTGPVILIDVRRWSGWSYSPAP